METAISIGRQGLQIAEVGIKFCGRFSKDWRLVPALFLLITQVVAVALAVINGHHYLALIYLAGVISAAYAVALAYDYRHLSDYGKLNEALGVTNEDFGTKLGFFGKKILQLQEISEKQKAELEGQLARYLAENSQHKALNSEQGQQIAKLREENEAFQKTRAAVDAVLKDFAALISDQKLVLESGARKSAGHFEQLDRSAQSFQQKLSALLPIVGQLEAVQKATETYLGLFRNINSWFDPDEVERRLVKLHEAEEKLIAAASRMRDASVACQAEESRRDELRREIATLNAENAKLQQTRDEIDLHVRELRATSAEIDAHVREARQMVQEYRAEHAQYASVQPSGQGKLHELHEVSVV